jgi:hypothetical protein
VISASNRRFCLPCSKIHWSWYDTFSTRYWHSNGSGAFPVSCGLGHRGAAAAKIGANSIQHWELSADGVGDVFEGPQSFVILP